VAVPPQRRALGALFLVLALLIAGVAYGAGTARQWFVVVPAAAIAVWFAGLTYRAWKS
jgi:hypothetical protein